MLALAAHIPPVPCKTSSIFGPFFLGLLLLACDLALLHRAYLSFNMGRAPREILDKDMRCRAFIRAGWKHERFAQMALPVCVTVCGALIDLRDSDLPTVHSLLYTSPQLTQPALFDINRAQIERREAAAGGLTLLVQIPPAPFFLFLAYAANMGIYS
ncbi:hypothetical protein B0H13DRAFT_2363906 [Mycena leptocephala]|nr:hypothetical protein B0H13DRAFT_2363906 [Mycena leptocephala]